MSTTNPTNETTEWHDLQRKFGNLPPLEKEVKEEELYLKRLDEISNKNVLDKKNLKQLELLEEKCNDDEYLKVIEKYKRNRLQQIKKNKALAIFGDVYEVTKENFLKEINDASKWNPLRLDNENENKKEQEKENEEDVEDVKDVDKNEKWISNKKKEKKGTFVILHLYSENVVACKILNNILREVAKKYKHIKFTKGVYNKIIENYPESKMPTLLIYYNGVCVKQICNLLLYIDGGVSNLNKKSFERLLKKYNVIRKRKSGKGKGNRNEMSDEEKEEEEEEEEEDDEDENEEDDDDRDILSDDSSEEEENRKHVKTQKQYATFNMF